MLLSLLLVFSQQMGYAHALTHATALTALAASQTIQTAAPEQDTHLSGITKLGFDHSCAQCLAVAQFAAAVYPRFHCFPLLDGVAVIGAVAPLAPLPAAPCTAYHSRAPPVLSC